MPAQDYERGAVHGGFPICGRAAAQRDVMLAGCRVTCCHLLPVVRGQVAAVLSRVL